MTALATVEDVTKRLEDEPTEAMLRVIETSLEDASDAARFHGRSWEPEDCPPAVSRLVAQAVARFMRNPERLSQSRAGDETLAFQDSTEDWFTPAEVDRLRAMGRAAVTGFGTMQMAAPEGGTFESIVWVPVSSGGRPFPLLGGVDAYAVPAT